MDKERILKLYTALRDDVSLFASAFCTDICTHTIPSFHKEIYQLCQSEERLLIAAPRGFAKSSCAARVYALHSMLFKTRRDIVIISASEGLAIEHIRWIKQTLEGNDEIKALWNITKSDKWTETHLGIKHADGSICNIRARGAGAQIRGFRPDCIILDDIETDESVESEDQRRKLKGWLFKACLNSLKVNGQFIVIGTLIHPLAVIADLFTIPNHWTKRKWAAYKSDSQVAGNELWAELWDHDRLQARKREIGTTAFASEFLNNPMLDENAPIKDEDIRYWDDLPKQYSMVMAIDPAYSEDEKADFKACSLVAVDPNGNRYLVDYIRCHDTSLDFITQIANLYNSHSKYITAVGLPKSGGDREFFSTFERYCDEHKIYMPIVELKNTFVTASGQKIRNKHGRIKAALQPLFENGRYYIHSNHLECRDELLTLGSSQHDDLCLAGDTKVATIFGDKYISDIERGDLLITPTGIHKVLLKCYTGYKDTINKFGLTATPNHKIYANNCISSIYALPYNECIIQLKFKEVMQWR